MLNPYENINWDTSIPIISVSHCHATTQKVFDYLYDGGCRHMALSNYRPSVPYYPLPYGDITEIPDDVISCPNAEHFGWITDGHFNGLGIDFASGSSGGGWTPQNWKVAFDIMLLHLLYADGGGITINHLTWTNRNQDNIPTELAIKMLDYDDRILGIENITEYGRDNWRFDWPVWDNRSYWDEILLTGRRCWGFCVPDHDAEAQTGWTGEDWTGQNVLLLPQGTPTRGEEANHACLKAYRNGQFYSRLLQGNFAFTSISVNDKTITASTNSGTKIRFIEDGIATEYNGATASHTVSNDAVYCRIEAEDAENNLLMSQAITFKEYVKPKKQRMSALNIALLG